MADREERLRWKISDGEASLSQFVYISVSSG